MLELTVQSWVIAFLPLLALLVSMLWLKWSAPKAGLLSFIVAAICALSFFGADGFILGIACAKGISLAVFVLLIIWTSVFMYNVIDRIGGIKVIGANISRLAGGSRTSQALLLGWMFSGFVQGITGFGVPVAVVVPLLFMLGFPPVICATLVLVGHSWAVTFGSMASSYYTIQLVTGIAPASIGPAMAMLFALPTMITGFCVAYIEGGAGSLRKSALAVFITGAIVSFLVWLMASIGAFQIASVVPGIAGCGIIWLLSKTGLLRNSAQNNLTSPYTKSENSINFHLAFLPYYLLIFLTVLFQFPPFSDIGGRLSFGMDYPGLKSSLGYVVEPVKAYAKIGLFNHPAPLILMATLLTILVLVGYRQWQKGIGVSALKATVRQCLPTSIGIITMVVMSLIMITTGMTDVLARGIAKVTGVVFPIFSPYIGVLGCFMTGSNTNSNVMFGSLQVETAISLGISPLIIACAQSIGGSLGSAIAPAKVLIGSTLVGLTGREGEVIRKALPYCLLIVFFVGLEALLAIYVFHFG
jgi:lactate permease